MTRKKTVYLFPNFPVPQYRNTAEVFKKNHPEIQGLFKEIKKNKTLNPLVKQAKVEYETYKKEYKVLNNNWATNFPQEVIDYEKSKLDSREKKSAKSKAKAQEGPDSPEAEIKVDELEEIEEEVFSGDEELRGIGLGKGYHLLKYQAETPSDKQTRDIIVICNEHASLITSLKNKIEELSNELIKVSQQTETLRKNNSRIYGQIDTIYEEFQSTKKQRNLTETELEL